MPRRHSGCGWFSCTPASPTILWVGTDANRRENDPQNGLFRFWLQERHGCLIDDELPVPVPYALSDIDLVAMRVDTDGTPSSPQEPPAHTHGTLLIVRQRAT